jgi:putative transposase
MKKSKFTEEQIAFALHQADTGTSVEEVCRKIVISQATFYGWKKKFGGMGVSELRRRCAANRMERLELNAPNQVWSMDFVSGALFNGKKFRALTVVDNHTRECLAIEVGQSLTGNDVAMVLTEIAQGRELPSRIQADNGPEFISISLDKWAYDHGVTLDFSRPGKPTGNPFMESFNGSLRDECLNVHWFMSLEDARQKIETWRQDYNNFRPHSSLSDTAPALFARQFTGSPNSRNL